MQAHTTCVQPERVPVASCRSSFVQRMLCTLTYPSLPTRTHAGVGKSCLLLRFSEDSFTSSFITTIG